MDVTIAAPGLDLPGILEVPGTSRGLVVFAHGSGSSRLSPRNAQVARALNEMGMATLLFDLLSATEAADRGNVFDIGLLAERLGWACEWAGSYAATAELPIGLFGASTGAAAALVAATHRPDRVAAVVSRGGRPDLAGESLELVAAPTLLIVGGRDEVVLELNRRAAERLGCDHSVKIVPGATHLFEEQGALAEVSMLAGEWFRRWLV